MSWEANRTIWERDEEIYLGVCIQRAGHFKHREVVIVAAEQKLREIWIGSCLLHAGPNSRLYFHSSNTITFYCNCALFQQLLLSDI